MEHKIDYLGLRQEAAETLLKQQGVEYEIRLTAPPRKEQSGFFRVVKQDLTQLGKLILTVCAVPDAFEEDE